MSYSGRGKALENLIDYSNQIYANKNIARIDKIPTDWSVSFDKRKGRAKSAFPNKKGTVDYIGVYQGKAVAFDAKNTKSKTSLPLSNIQEHQVNYLRDFSDCGGISFLLVSFEILNEFYVISLDQVDEFWVNSKRGGRKSIPHSYFKENCNRVITGRGTPLDYLSEIGVS